MVEIPADDAVELPLSIFAALDGGPCMSIDAYRFNHCLPSIARKAEKSEVARLAKRIA